MWRELVALILAINVGGITHVTCESKYNVNYNYNVNNKMLLFKL